MKLIVAAFRTLANRPRLRLLHAIHAQPGITVHALAAAVRQPLYTTSHHLKLLSEYRFIHTQPSGRHVQCQPVQTPTAGNRFLSSLQAWVQDLFAPGDLDRTVVQVCEPGTTPSWEAVFEALVKLCTTYTHLRRLLILREVARRGACSSAELMEAVGMSADATRRQVAKLCRRGLLAADETAPDRWQLAPPAGPDARRQLWSLVRLELLNE